MGRQELPPIETMPQLLLTVTVNNGGGNIGIAKGFSSVIIGALCGRTSEGPECDNLGKIQESLEVLHISELSGGAGDICHYACDS